MRGRHVGILPRDRAEHERLLGLFGAAAAATPAVPGVVEVHVREDDLAGDGEEVLPCIDVLFVAGALDWDAYAARIEGVQQAFLERLTPSVASPASGTDPRSR